MRTKKTIKVKIVLAFIGYNIIFGSILAPFVVLPNLSFLVDNDCHVDK